MRLTTDLRLPGVYFLPTPERPAAGLPPLDVAAFVGFAARGPLDFPVAIEDAAMYAAVFGRDLALAREEGGAIAWANLPASVNLFFANGGRRCYVVRVAGQEASRTRFRLPGVVALPEEDEPRLASLYAAWPGRWSEKVQLATRLQWAPLPAADFAPAGAGQLAWQAGGAADSLQPGDLLQLTVAGETWLAPVAAVAAGEETFMLAMPQAWRLASEVDDSPPPAFDGVARLGLDGPERLDLIVTALTGAAAHASLTLSGDDAAALEQGDVLWLQQGADGGYLFPVTELGPVQVADSPPTGEVEAQAPYLLSLPAIAFDPTGPPEQVARLRFDLLAREEAQRLAPLAGLAFNSGHPRFWGELAYLASSPLQQSSSAPDMGRRASEAARFYHALSNGQRLPDEERIVPDPAAFGALLAPLDEAGAAATFLPLAMLSIITEADYRGPDPGKVGDDDLGAFDPDRFFDEALEIGSAISSPDVLRSAAFDRLYVQNRRLRGLHSLFFVDETALVSLPDAVHRAWQPASPPEPAEVTPWTAEPYDGGEFLVCQLPPVIEYLLPAQGTTLGGTMVTITGRRFTASEQTAVFFGSRLAGSVVVLDEQTLTCIAPPAAAPGPVTVTVVNWFGADARPDAFTYVPPPEAHLPLMDEALDYDETPLRRAQKRLITFCQARRDVVAILSLPAHYLPLDCQAWQENLRRDFGLPSWGYSRSENLDLPDLSYAAAYHPWLLIADAASPGGLRPVPADGAACGQIALRERRRQVWVAPANQPVQGVLGLAQSLSADNRFALFERGFNLAGREVGVFRFISAYTQSDSRLLQQLSVRRLLILLRKIAHERGMDYVFESNDERFRASVQFALEELLLGLYERGAFAGASPQQAFRVSTGPDINPPQSVDQGRFIAQIQVAPSQPLEFITVLLLRAGDGVLQAVESS